MKKENKPRLILYGSLSIVVALGLTSKLVKVPIKETVVKVDYVKPKKIVEETHNKITYSFELPKDYLLKEENREFIGYREYSEEINLNLSLDQYVLRKIAK